MLIEYFQTLYDYNYWANAKILDAARQVSEAQFIEETPDSHGSLRGTLVHTLGAEWMWRSRWLEEEQQMRAFLDALQDEHVQRVVQYTNTEGKTYAAPVVETHRAGMWLDALLRAFY